MGRVMARRYRKLALATLAAAVLMTVPAAAEPLFCRQLQQQYQSVNRVAASSGGGDLSSLRIQLDQARNQASALGCNGGFFFFARKPSPQCPAVMRKVSQLQRSVNQAGGGAFGFGFGFSAQQNRQQAAAQRDQLRNVLIQNGCDVPSQSFAFGFGGGGGGYRTVCVRTCDGYYFPISYSTGRQRFKIDEAVCKSMYSGEDARLYAYPTGGDSAQAISIDGKSSYSNETFAFSYRQSFSSACVTQLKDGLAALAKMAPPPTTGPGNNPANVAETNGTVASVLPFPVPRPDPSEDPETLANASGGFTVELVPDQGVEVADLSGKVLIRTVGPGYYYRPSQKIDFAKKPWAPDLSPPDFSLIGSAEAAEMPPRHAPAEARAPRDDAAE